MNDQELIHYLINFEGGCYTATVTEKEISADIFKDETDGIEAKSIAKILNKTERDFYVFNGKYVCFEPQFQEGGE